MFTLFEVMADPQLSNMKWAMQGDPVMVAFFVVFTIFGSFAMVSILTGVISESMIEKGNNRREELRIEEERRQAAFIESLRAYFSESDKDGDGHLDRAEFDANLPRLVEMFQAEGVNYKEADLCFVFDLLDYDGS